MTKRSSSSSSSSSFQRDLLNVALRALMVLLLFRGCDATLSNIDLSTTTLNPATTGFMVSGNAVNDFFGYSVRTAGDINNDGYEDMIVGAHDKKSYQGAAYVIYGGATSSMSNIDLSTTSLDPATTGFTITGNAAGDHFGISVSTAGDINHDGYDDIIVGASYKSYNKLNKGVAYVIYGGPKPSMSNIDLSTTTLDPATTGFMITGPFMSYLGSSVSAAGDINRDGYGDIIVGALWQDLKKGAAYVIYGGSKSSMSNIDLSLATLDPATTGFKITGNLADDSFGGSVNRAGDIDNDGYDDIIIGAEGKNLGNGAAYVIYGGPKSSMANIDLSTSALNPRTTGFIMTGNGGVDHFGGSVSTVGDLNNDGYADIIIGAEGKNNYQGAAYVVYGGPKSSMSNINLKTTTLDPATTGFIITGNSSYDHLGHSVSTAGDVNHDGYSDIIVGAPVRGTSRGAAYVVFGGPKSSLPNIDLSSTTLDPAATGFTITGNAGGDQFGWSVSTAGDINHDGYSDIIAGAYGKNGYKGAEYVIYGGPKPSMSNIAF